MELIIKKGNVLEEQADAFALLWSADSQMEQAKMVDKSLKSRLSLVAKDEAFKGKPGETLVEKIDGKKIVLCGVGAKKDVTEESVRIAAASALNCLKKFPKGKLVIAFDVPGNVGTFETAKAIAEGLMLGSYRYGTFKKLEDEGPTSVTLVLSTPSQFKAAEQGFKLGQLFAEATVKARDMVNHPGGYLTPLELAKVAEYYVKGKANVSIKLYHKAELTKMGAGGILGIAQGSDHDPVMVHMVYKPRGAKKKIALVGKAVTFDSGGLSIKTAGGMETMKCDMAGAAAVIGVFSAIDQLKPNVEVHGIFGACENMLGGNAIRPGDVVKTLNGKTIEILNTDAEGRVTLADTLAFAARQEPDAIVDLATLTGAIVVSLGEEITGLMSNNPALAKKIMSASQEAGEKMWEMPLEKNYKDQIKSDVADYRNIAGRWGGSITAGLLLEEFIDNRPWVHLDIAGPAFAERPFNAYTKKGGTGHGVRTLLTWLGSF